MVKLNNENYQSWQFSMKMLLIREDLWDYVSPGVAPNPVTDAWRKGDLKAIATIALLVENTQHFLIQDATTAKSTWEALQKYHSKATLTSKRSLLKQICNKKYENGEDMEKYLFEFNELFAKLRNAGKQLDEDLKVTMILGSLPASFDSLCVALEARQDDLTLEMIRGKLIDHVLKTKETKEEDGEKALKASFKKPICYHCEKEGHIKRNCREYQRSKKSDSSESEDEKKEQKSEKKKKHKVRSVRESFQEFSLAVRNVTMLSDDWIVDTGASSHMCCKKELFDSLDESRTSEVYEASGEKLKVFGVGKLTLKAENRDGKVNNLILNDVLYVPALDSNLFSVRKACEKGLTLKCSKDDCKLNYGRYNVAVGVYVGNIPILKLKKKTKAVKRLKSPKVTKPNVEKTKEEVIWIESILPKHKAESSDSETESSNNEGESSYSHESEDDSAESVNKVQNTSKIQKEISLETVRKSVRDNFGVPPKRFGFLSSVKDIINKTTSGAGKLYDSFSDSSTRVEDISTTSSTPGTSPLSGQFEFD